MNTTPQVDFSTSDLMVPRYRYAKIVLNNLSSSQVPFNLTSQTLAEFKIPSSTVCNFSKSFIIYQYSVPSSGVAGQYAAVHEQSFDFQQVFFGSGSGLGIVDLQYANRYKKAVTHLRSQLENDFLGGFQDQMTQFYPSRQPAVSNVYPQSLDGLTAGVANASPLNYTDSQQLVFSPLPSGAAVQQAPNPGTITVTRQVPLSVLKDTFFEMDKDVVFGSDMYLRLWTAALQQMIFYTPNPATPHIGAAAYNGAVINASNFYLQLAIEENLDIRNSLLMSLAKGSIKFNVPYSYAYRFSQVGGAGASTTANLSLTLTKNYGKSLNRILFVPFSANEFTCRSQDHTNINGTKVTSLQTTLNGRPLQDSLVQCYNANATSAAVLWPSYPTDVAGDWRQIREFAKGSCLQSYSHYSANWTWQDSWGLQSYVDEKLRGKSWYTNLEGLSLVDSGDLIYSIQANVPAVAQAAYDAYSGLILYLFCSFNRTLQIQADGIVLSA
jgi:hypothetical protein